MNIKTLVISSIVSLTASSAFAANHYKLTITNGSAMPISPGLVYVTDGAAPLTKIGDQPSQGLVQLCQTGNPMGRIQEAQNSKRETYLQQTMGPILPGQSIEVTVPVTNGHQSIHFEAMYGKTKDTCAFFSTTPSSVTTEGRDEAVATGVFLDPAIPSGRTLAEVCQSAAAAVDCLRLLAEPNQSPKTRFFPGYLPSVLQALEEKYGSSDTQSLVIPTGGAVRIEVVAE